MQGILRKITKTNQSAMSPVNCKERWREPGLIFSEKNEKRYHEAVEKCGENATQSHPST